MQLFKIFRIVKLSKKKGKNISKEIYEICVEFNSYVKYEAYKSDLIITMRMILKVDDLKVSYNWEKRKVSFFITHQNAIINKSEEDIKLMVKKWKQKLKQHMICKFYIKSNINCELGVIWLYLK